MVQIIPEKRRPSVSQQFGQAFANLGQAAGQAVPEMLKQQQQNKQLEKLGLGDVIGIQDPNMRQMIMSDQLNRGRRMQKEKFKSQLGGGGTAPDQQQPEMAEVADFEESVDMTEVEKPRPKKKKAGKSKKFVEDMFFEEGGQLPSQTTRDRPRPVLSGDELRAQAQQNVARANAQGIDYSLQEAEADLASQNQANAAYNQQIELEKGQRREIQRDYGNRAVSKLTKLVPEATDEVQSIFRKIGEQAASANKSEAAIDELVSEKAKDYKNALNRVRQSKRPPRTFDWKDDNYGKLGRFIFGGETDIEVAKAKMRNQVQPLLDMGLYDTARAELADRGWYPEEVETLIDQVEPESRQVLSSIPAAPKAGTKEFKKWYLEGGNKRFQQENYPVLVDSMREILSSNPDENLILLRREAEEKGYNWRTFSQAINELLQNGEIELEADQMNMLNRINEPPLYMLDQMAYDLGFGGK